MCDYKKIRLSVCLSVFLSRNYDQIIDLAPNLHPLHIPAVESESESEADIVHTAVHTLASDHAAVRNVASVHKAAHTVCTTGRNLAFDHTTVRSLASVHHAAGHLRRCEFDIGYTAGM